MKIKSNEIVETTKPSFKIHSLCRYIRVTKEWIEDDIIGIHLKEKFDKHNR